MNTYNYVFVSQMYIPASILNDACTCMLQGVVTPIGAILKAATGDTTKSPGHGGFFSSVTESRRFSRRLKTVTGSKASRFKRNARDPFYFIMILFMLWS